MENYLKYVIPKTPCNIDPLIGASLIGLGVSGISSAIGAISADKTNKQNYQYQRALMQEQHTLGKENLGLQHRYNLDSLQRAYALEALYNSPLVQKSRMLDAGLNPYYNEAGAVSAQSNPNPSSVGLPAASFPSFQYQSPWAAFANLPAEFANVANATKAIAEAKKTGVDTTMQERAMEDYLKEIHERWRGSKLANDYQQVITNWYQENGASYLDEQDRKLSMEIGNLLATGNLADAQKELADAQKENQIKNNALFDKIENFLEKKAEWEANTAHAQYDATRAQEGMFNAQADASKSNALSQRIIANAAYKQAVTAEENGKFYRINLHEASKLTQAQKNDLIQNSIAMYEDASGIHLNKQAVAKAQGALLSLLESQQRQSYIQSINPLTYLGAIFGGALNVGAKLIK